MADPRALETRLGKDKAYSRASDFTDKERSMGFVCPRADAYGAREGVIPPGVAAIHGLVPKGMRRIAPGDTAKHANEARDEGRTDVEQYREYYAQGAEAQRKAAAYDAALAAPASTPRRPVQEPAFRDPDDNGMFSRYPDPPPDDNTLDGFYEGLRRESPGTAGRPGEAARGMVSVAGDMAPGGPQPGEGRAYPAASPVHGDQDAAQEPLAEPPSDPPDSTAAAFASLVAERDQMRQMANDLSAEVGRLREMLEGYAARDQHYANIEQELAAEREARKSAEAAVQPPAETVRVALSEQEQKLKVGGRGWECNIMGALHFGRSDRSLVLTVSDPGYASDLFAEIQPGEVAILSAVGRTSCTYSGRCAKIYGDAGSPDFIAVLWLDVVPAE